MPHSRKQGGQVPPFILPAHKKACRCIRKHSFPEKPGENHCKTYTCSRSRLNHGKSHVGSQQCKASAFVQQTEERRRRIVMKSRGVLQTGSMQIYPPKKRYKIFFQAFEKIYLSKEFIRASRYSPTFCANWHTPAPAISPPRQN